MLVKVRVVLSLHVLLQILVWDAMCTQVLTLNNLSCVES